MSRCVQLYNEYTYKSRITGSQYIDPEGFEYNRDIVTCRDCIFVGCEGCVLYKEKGMSESQIKEKVNSVSSEHYCDYFLIENFSEGDSEDEKVRKEVLSIAKSLGCSTGRTRRLSGGSSKRKGNNWFIWAIVIGALVWFFSK